MYLKYKKVYKKKLLITGANGFIGSFLVEEALDKGFEVYAGVRNNSNLGNLPVNDINIINFNLNDKDDIKEKILKVNGFDYVIHVAGITKACDKSQFDFVNYQLSKNLVEALVESNRTPLKYLQISSLAAYGPGDSQIMKPIKNSDKPNPISEYGKSKLKFENYLKTLSDFPYLIFRPTGVFGPREKDFYVMYKSINNGIETYIGSKNQALTFIYVKDLVYLLIDALDSEMVQRSYFVSDLKSYTAQDFNSVIKKVMNKKTITTVVPKTIVRVLALLNEKISCFLFKKSPTLNTDKFREISQNNWLCDSTDLVIDFDFKPKYTLQQGLKETIDWYKSQKKL